jgi:hypothetical protein
MQDNAPYRDVRTHYVCEHKPHELSGNAQPPQSGLRFLEHAQGQYSGERHASAETHVRSSDRLVQREPHREQ